MRTRLVLAVAAITAIALLVPERARAQEQVPTTVNVGQGRSVTVGANEHGAGTKGMVPPGWTVREGRANQQFLNVNGQDVGMAVSAGPEGKLQRVHVDAAEGSDLTVVIGFYDKIASQNALQTQETYECRACGKTIVCSVSPSCAN